MSGDVKLFTIGVTSGTVVACNTDQGGTVTNDLPAATSGAEYVCENTFGSTETTVRLVAHIAVAWANLFARAPSIADTGKLWLAHATLKSRVSQR